MWPRATVAAVVSDRRAARWERRITTVRVPTDNFHVLLFIYIPTGYIVFRRYNIGRCRKKKEKKTWCFFCVFFFLPRAYYR